MAPSLGAQSSISPEEWSETFSAVQKKDWETFLKKSVQQRDKFMVNLQTDSLPVGMVSENISIAYIAMGKFEEALVAVNDAESYYRKGGNIDQKIFGPSVAAKRFLILHFLGRDKQTLEAFQVTLRRAHDYFGAGSRRVWELFTEYPIWNLAQRNADPIDVVHYKAAYRKTIMHDDKRNKFYSQYAIDTGAREYGSAVEEVNATAAMRDTVIATNLEAQPSSPRGNFTVEPDGSYIANRL